MVVKVAGCGRFTVGDNGQRFEHHAKRIEDGEDIRLGWSETRNDPTFRKMVLLSPSWKDYYYIDRYYVDRKTGGKKK